MDKERIWLKELLAFDFMNPIKDTRKRKDWFEINEWTGFAENFERYFFDYKLKAKYGRCQLDTTDDAPYYWMWVNFGDVNNGDPLVVEYVEGDIYVIEFTSQESLANYIKDMKKYFRGIDWWLGDEINKKIDMFLNTYDIKNYAIHNNNQK